MSMPSSRALVATTARTSPLRSPASMVRRFTGQIAAAIAADASRATDEVDRRLLAWRSADPFAQVREQQLGNQTRAAEDDGLRAAEHAACGQLLRGQRAALAQPAFRVVDGRVVEDDVLLAAGRAVLVDERDRRFQISAFGQFGRVGDGGAGADELGLAAVERRRCVAAAAGRWRRGCQRRRDRCAVRPAPQSAVAQKKASQLV